MEYLHDQEMMSPNLSGNWSEELELSVTLVQATDNYWEVHQGWIRLPDVG